MNRSQVLSSVVLSVLAIGSGCASESASFQGYTSGSKAPAAQPGAYGGYAQHDMDSSAPAATGAPRSEAPSPEARPGLGTTWGESRRSVISTSPFERADQSSPFATAAVFYNDENGARAMANATGFKRMSRGEVPVGGGVASVFLKDESGNFLSGFEASGKKFLVGEAGSRYSIVIQSHVPARMELVVSVDGLDVMDGKDASFAKRGYLIDPNSTIEIDGFRQSMESVAAFRFGSVADSYSNQKHGSTRNVGVIGVAAFNERGTNPASWMIGADTSTRLQADPFPGRFATPPR